MEVLLTLSLLINRLNQLLDLLIFLPSGLVAAESRLTGRCIGEVFSPSWYEVLRAFLLNIRLMLPGRMLVGEVGESVAGRLVPARVACAGTGLGEGSRLTFAFFPLLTGALAASPISSIDFVGVIVLLGVVAGAGAAASKGGEGGGGGISVPSVREPNLKLRAGSSKRFPVVPLEVAGIVRMLSV